MLSIPTRLTAASPHDPRSESSSITDAQPTNMTILVERVAALLTRMTQADALTLTHRLKRQNLKGADLGHLSRVNVGGIVSEAGNLRLHFRHLLEDDKVVTACTRKDLRGLFKLFKDAFVEMGQMRVTINDVILDPSIAGRLRETTLNPSKAETTGLPVPSIAGGWMAPISKLFGASGGEVGSPSRELTPGTKEDGRGRARSRPPHRIIPKLGPALSASTTTVNVEFSGSGIGRAVTNTIKAQGETTVDLPSATSSGSPYRTSNSVMGIFAGAPQGPAQDSWVVLQKPPQTSPATRSNMLGAPSSLGKDGTMHDHNAKRISRNVDAIIDANSPVDDEVDAIAPLIQRTLRRRVLSDSSIHSTFMSQSDDSRLVPHGGDGPSARETFADKVSVLRALSRTVQNFRFTASLGSQPLSGGDSGAAPVVPAPVIAQARSTDDHTTPSRPQASSPLTAILPTMPSWAGVSATVEAGSTEPFFVGSHEEESLLRQSR